MSIRYNDQIVAGGGSGGGSSLPDQSGFTDAVLKTNGSNASWNELSDLPSDWCLTSATTSSLTIGASGATYQAPANGWFAFNTNAGVLQVNIGPTSHGITSNTISESSSNYGAKVVVPVLKGRNATLRYSTSASNVSGSFIYAVGSADEANQ